MPRSRSRPMPPSAAAAGTATVAPLTPEQRGHLERRLLEERARVLRALARGGLLPDAHTGDGRAPAHLAELGTETMLESLAAACVTRESATLAEIDAALRRLYREPARFGLDELTREPIPFARLDVIPWARRAVSAAA